jgi:putative membrane protein
MFKLFLRWILLVVALIASSKIAQFYHFGFYVNYSSTDALIRLFMGTAIWALLNATVGSLLKVISMPITILTLGLFTFVINAALFYFASKLNLGFRVDSFMAALIGVILISVINALLGALFLGRK